jgi:pyruvate kinase
VTTKGQQHKWFGDVRVGELIAIDDGRIVLRVEQKSGQQARIRLEFAKPTTVERVEPAMASFARQGLR